MVVMGLVTECQALMAMQTFPSQIEWWDDVMYAGALFEVIPERQWWSSGNMDTLEISRLSMFVMKGINKMFNQQKSSTIIAYVYA